MTDELVGRVFDGRYQIIEPLAAGGMATVYRAHQLNVDREVAIKIMLPDDRSEHQLVARFQSEAKIISELRHPNTLKLIDYGVTDDGMLYIVTELLSGRPLSKAIREDAPMDPRRVLSIVRDVCLSLAEAHGRGIVHRDLKPANIFLEQVGEQEVVKVLDFGVAKVTPSEAIEKRAASDATPQTMAGVILGTPSYLSPEQAFGRAVDGRSDLYSLGVVAFQCLCGALPFGGEAIAQIAAHGLENPPRPSRTGAKPDLPPKIEALILRLLDKTPDARAPSAAALAKEIEALLAAPTESGSKISSLVWLAPVLAAVAAIGAYVALEEPAPPPHVPTPVDAGPLSDSGVTLPIVEDPEDAGAPDAEVIDAGFETGLRILAVVAEEGFDDEAAVRAALVPAASVLVACHEGTQSPDDKRVLDVQFVVTNNGNSISIEPKDDSTERFRRCIATRLPQLRWPKRKGTGTVIVTIGE